MLQIRLVPFDRGYLEKSWTWLNDPEVKALTLTPNFTRQDQERFFASLPTRSEYRVWGLESLNAERIGAVGLKHIDQDHAELWCYIGERSFWGQGVIGEILKLAEVEARKLGIASLYIVAAVSNERSLAAFHKRGFEYDDRQPRDDVRRLTKRLDR